MPGSSLKKLAISLCIGITIVITGLINFIPTPLFARDGKNVETLPWQSVQKPNIVDRKSWGAKAPILSRMKRQTPREIIVHHTGVRQQPKISLERKLRGLQSYSQKDKRWGDAPYHYYIGVSGRIGDARDVRYAGDTNTDYSVNDRIQVVVEGHFDQETPNQSQLAALKALVTWLADKHRISAGSISGHNDHAQTDCPGKRLKPYLQVLRANVTRQKGATGRP